MTVLRLEKPLLVYKEQILDYKQEFLAANESMDGSGVLAQVETIEEFIALSEQGMYKVLPRNFVLATQFLLIEETKDKLVGMMQIRHTLDKKLAVIGGHIGYSVRKSMRSQGYAKIGLRLALLYCQSHLQLSRVLLTCRKDNFASRKVILSQGGIRENEVMFGPYVIERYWIELNLQ